MTQNLLGLSACVLKYATAISDPWSPDAEGVCIPTFPSRASMKITSFARFTVTIGTNGVGFAMVSPCLANDINAVWYSSATYAGTAANAPSVTATTIGNGTTPASAITNNPFTSSQMTAGSETSTPSVMGRVVSVGVSVQYTGTKLNEGGLIYGLVTPNHGSTNSLNVPLLAAYREAYVQTSSSRKHWFSMAGQSNREVQYPDYGGTITNDDIGAKYPFSNGQQLDPTQGSSGAPPFLVFMTGEVGNTFEVEIVQHSEYVGSATQASLTPSHSDATGFQVVNTAAALVQQKATQKPGAPKPSLMREAITETLRALRPVAEFGVKLAKSPAGQAAIYRAGQYALTAL